MKSGEILRKSHDFLADVSLLVLRVVLGVTFIVHGWGKFSGGLGDFAGSLESLGVPLPLLMAWLTALTELVGGALLVVGLLSRLAGAGIAVVMLVAIIKVHGQHGFLMNHFLEPGKQHGYEFCLNLLAMAVVVFLSGAGRFSLDRVVRRVRSRRKGDAGGTR